LDYIHGTETNPHVLSRDKTMPYAAPKQTKEAGEISGSHGGEHKDGCLLGWCAV
jgi:hypothetical protein